ncbi:MAG: hypothetical protein EOO54_20985 [Haliea sp.]|nr:MAG: hypothetical protein EOO54_20985 [Haliea sp.]
MNNEHEKKTGTGTGAVVGAAAGGVAGGAAAGAMVGGMTGPVGAAVGAVVGAAVGAMAGRKAADPALEDKYWSENYASRPYARKDASFDDYSPAYRTGVESYGRNAGRSFDEVEPELSRGWASNRGRSSLEWEHAKPAARDAWDRLSNTVERAIPGDSDKDGR